MKAPRIFFQRLLGLTLFAAFVPILLGSSALPMGVRSEPVRAFTRSLEFDYAGWTLDALWIKLGQFSLGTAGYMDADARHHLVVDYLTLVAQIQQGEARLNDVYANPDIPDPQAASTGLRQELAGQRARRDQMAPIAEAILQDQIASTVARLDLTVGGQPLPPVLYHSTPLPWALIISPRTTIRQDEDISLIPDMTVDRQVALEAQVDQALNVSSLVVAIGGVGVYPTMVQQTSSLDWLSEVVAHEWVHNFLTLRPLGASYLSSPELRIMNETTASIAGKEIGRLVIEHYYPELIPPPAAAPSGKEPSPALAPAPPAPPEFNYRAEMHTTRVTADALLAQGKVDEAEAYMESRRELFWDHGYHLRKLNQAYFAFYGAYADQPGGAAGSDPVGTAVRALRAQSPTLAVFLNRISWMASFEQLEKAVARP